MVTVNITLELENNEEVLSFEHWIKQYANVKKAIESSVKSYCKDVKLRKFPFNKNVYK